jgi:hypothetical protein
MSRELQECLHVNSSYYHGHVYCTQRSSCFQINTCLQVQYQCTETAFYDICQRLPGKVSERTYSFLQANSYISSPCRLFNDAVRLYNFECQDYWWIGKDLEGTGWEIVEEFASRQKHANLRQNDRYSHRDSNLNLHNTGLYLYRFADPLCATKRTTWPESASEIYRQSDPLSSAKLVPTCACVLLLHKP